MWGQGMPETVRRWLLTRVPPRVTLPARALKNWRCLHGFHAPACRFARWVPPGRAAIDVGAAYGVYAYWIAARAGRVVAFEPRPDAYRYLREARLPRVVAVQVALSDYSGVGRLSVPEGNEGEARLDSAETATNGRYDLHVPVRKLDDYRLTDVGFMKVDVEGHELSVLRGANETIARCRPRLFIEVEERHHASSGGVQSVLDYVRGTLEYAHSYVVRRGELFDSDTFDVWRDQLEHLPRVSSPQYANNFLFSDDAMHCSGAGKGRVQPKRAAREEAWDSTVQVFASGDDGGRDVAWGRLRLREGAQWL